MQDAETLNALVARRSTAVLTRVIRPWCCDRLPQARQPSKDLLLQLLFDASVLKSQRVTDRLSPKRRSPPLTRDVAPFQQHAFARQLLRVAMQASAGRLGVASPMRSHLSNNYDLCIVRSLLASAEAEAEAHDRIAPLMRSARWHSRPPRDVSDSAQHVWF
jgi:hypothetical protein